MPKEKVKPVKQKEIKERNVNVSKKGYESSSEEEDLDDENILNTVFKSYTADSKQLLKIRDFLENFLQSGSGICLICIGSVKRADAIWSCGFCSCFFHLSCIKRWANDSISQQKLNAKEDHGYYRNDGTYVPKQVKPIRWCCPQCRRDYKPDDVPKVYECFCTKELNPPFHPWLIPHSCGEICGKYLQPDCGHQCILLCHPGPCPDCPQNITVSCKCGLSPKKTIRCFQKSWSCNKKCLRKLGCGIHVCEQLCHEIGKCPPCTKKSSQPCECGREKTSRNCYELKWKCSRICNKLLNCEKHKCSLVCHAGSCGDCPLSLPRTCPCGKTTSVAPCDSEIETCGDTCQKPLECGVHFCTQKCHKGECSACLIIVEKRCRCGQHTKELPCSKIFTCETKCKRLRDCEKHVCNKKCCDGQCPACDKICAKTLTCRKHKCKSVCHDGPCYPCELRSQVKCRCGFTSITVPCGREKKVRPPKCHQPCRLPVRCHHQNPHRCHMNYCPPCTQICELKNDTTKCDHPCQSRCHTGVIVPNPNRHEYGQPEFIAKNLPHPKCEVKVPLQCIGGHEISSWPCWAAKVTSCGRKCNRQLKCTNHKCEKECHAVSDVNSQIEQLGCEKCEEKCMIARPQGCIHPCQKPCHLAPCDPCSVFLKLSCHCGLNQLLYKCSEYNKETSNDNSAEEKLKSCGNRCIRNYPCGHRCTAICHSGACPNPDQCKKKVKIYCNCKNVKMEVSCDKHRNGLTSIECNENCAAKKEMQQRQENEAEQRRRKLEEERNRLELEQFEKKFGKKKYRERTKTVKVSDNATNFKLWILLASLIVIILLAYLSYMFIL